MSACSLQSISTIFRSPIFYDSNVSHLYLYHVYCLVLFTHRCCKIKLSHVAPDIVDLAKSNCHISVKVSNVCGPGVMEIGFVWVVAWTKENNEVIEGLLTICSVKILRPSSILIKIQIDVRCQPFPNR